MYGLKLTKLNTSGIETASNAVNIQTTKPIGGITNSLLQVTYDEPYQFQIDISSERPLDYFELSKINSWLFAKSSYRPLIFNQYDLLGVYFNCIITTLTDVLYLNKTHTIRCTVICDSQFAHYNPKTERFSLPSYYNRIEVYNQSDCEKDLFPTIKFKLTGTNNAFKIVNKTYADIESSFIDLNFGEEITVDGTNQIISSSTGLRRIGKFNKVFLPLKRGKNILDCYGAVDNLEITSEFLKLIRG